MKSRSPFEKRNRRIYDLRKAGATCDELGKLYNVSRMRISQLTRNYEKRLKVEGDVTEVEVPVKIINTQPEEPKDPDQWIPSDIK